MVRVARWSFTAAGLIALTVANSVDVLSQIPTPESVLGFRAGEDFHLATYDQSLEYFRRLDDASDRVRLMEVGRTSEERRWYVALISSAENLANIERYKEISRRLAHPKGLTDEEARIILGVAETLLDEARTFIASLPEPTELQTALLTKAGRMFERGKANLENGVCRGRVVVGTSGVCRHCGGVVGVAGSLSRGGAEQTVDRYRSWGAGCE